MTSVKKILYTAIASACLFPFSINAQMLEEEAEELAPVYASEIEIGIGYSSEDSFKFGKYNGLEDEDPYFIGNLDVRKNRSADDSSKDYWELSARNLGLTSRQAYGEFTRENSFSVYFDYDQIQHNLDENVLTPYGGSGTDVLTLPANWVVAGDTSGMTQLIPSLQAFDVERERQKYGGGIRYHISDQWMISGNYHREDRDGTDTIGAIFGTTGGNPRGAVVATPIDWQTDEFDIGLAYKGEQAQFTLTYNLSVFDNDSTSLQFDNAFDNAAWAAASQGSAGAVGQLSNIFPDNDAWAVNFTGGYNWSPRSRLTANVSYGEMNQDDDFLPMTSIAGLVNAIPLPRDNLDGEIDNLYANVNLTHIFNNNFDVKARFTYDDRNNKTPEDVYVRIANDSEDQPGLIPPTDNERVNRPYSFERLKFEFDAGYRFMPMTKLTAGYAYEEMDRDFQEVKETEEHSFHINLNTMPADWMSAWVKYTYFTRDGSTYVSNLPVLVGHSEEFIAEEEANNPDDLFENDPLVRKFYMADRDRDQFSAMVNFFPNDEVVLSVSGKYSKDDYDHSESGLQEATLGSLTFDVGYSPSDAFTGYGFFTIEKNDYHQRGFEHPGFLGALTPTTDRIAVFGPNWWQMSNEDSVYTVGGGFDWEVIEDKFKLSLDVAYSDATTDVKPFAEDDLGFQPDTPLPDVNTRFVNIRLKGDYKFQEGWGGRVYYAFERYDSEDFALDNVTVDTLANVILLGNVVSPTYNAHVVGVTIYHEF